MDKKRVCAGFFSPCGSAKKIAECIAGGLASELGLPLEVFDFTLPQNRENELSFSAEDIFVICTPVYAGRVPNKIMPYIRDHIHGNNSLCVCAVSYGNRSFDNALSELVYLMSKNGMQVISAAAVVSEHSFSGELAGGRPNGEDMEQLGSFSVRTAEKILAGDTGAVSVPGEMPPERYYTPLKEDGTPAKFLKAAPKVDEEKCIKCGKCAEVCPMGSVSRDDPSEMTGACIKCQACIKACSRGARYFDDADFLSHRQMLLNNYTDRKESAFFI